MKLANRIAAAEARRASRWGGLLLLVAIIVALALADHRDLPDSAVLVPVELLVKGR